jgi:hypothetical protein
MACGNLFFARSSACVLMPALIVAASAWAVMHVLISLGIGWLLRLIALLSWRWLDRDLDPWSDRVSFVFSVKLWIARLLFLDIECRLFPVVPLCPSLMMTDVGVVRRLYP